MTKPVLRLRSVAIVAATLLLAPLASPVAPAQAATCPSGDLRYPFREGGPKTFGVFKLKITGGGCATAHRVAKRWMTRFESNLERGRVKLPKSVRGFTFRQLPPNAAQTYRLAGRRGSTTIRFNYVVPNG